ncbi:MAG: SDR family oxidoreductase [Marinilabiliaceae bacterium]|nr:SDR family oxidoreductase [Marinilabiliaceae bacterium]
MLDLIGKKILISGASSGIGRECAIFCSKIGATLIIIGRDKSRLQNTLDSLSGKNHIQLLLDITDFESLESVISKAIENIGKIDGFLHCAGIESTVPLRSMNAKKYRELFSVNTISALELSRIISKKKNINPNGASFIFISSVMGILGASGKVGYCSSKSALISASKAMAVELAPKKIRVNCVLPGMVETEMTKKMILELPTESAKEIKTKHPLGYGETIDIANLCAFLLSDLSKWITGTELVIDGGYSCQ